VTLTDAEVLGAGRLGDAAPSPRPWRRWLPGLALPLVAATALGAVLWESQPWATPPDTGVRLLVASPDDLTWVDVDSGSRTSVPVEPGWRQPQVVGDGVVVQYPSSDPILADRVVGYRAGEPPNEVGEADRVVTQPGSALWLVVDGDPPDGGAVALTTAFGQWRSRVFTVPPRMEVVGAADDGLVVVRGPFRYRSLQLWDVQLGEVVRDFGLVIGARQVAENRALVTTGCLTSGCNTAVLDLATGKQVDVTSPAGYRESGVPQLTDDGVAGGLTGPDGSPTLAVGRPESLAIVDLGELSLARGADPLTVPGGWLALTTSDGSVVLWRDGLDAEQWPTVSLGPEERVVGVSG
jgi:hypothetical protein